MPIKTPNESAIDHANRLWEAEKARGSQIDARITQIGASTLIIFSVMMSLLVWSVSAKSDPVVSDSIQTIVQTLLLFGVICSGCGWAMLVFGDSQEFKDSEDPLKALNFQDGDADIPVRNAVFRRIGTAYQLLRYRNTLKEEKLYLGQQWFSVGVAFLFSAILVYLWARACRII